MSMKGNLALLIGGGATIWGSIAVSRSDAGLFGSVACLVLGGIASYTISKDIEGEDRKDVAKHCINSIKRAYPYFAVSQMQVIPSGPFIAVDYNAGVLCIIDQPTNPNPRPDFFRNIDIVECELIENNISISKTSTTSSTGSMMKRAIVGGVAFGGVGAGIGALTGKKTSDTITTKKLQNVKLHIVVNNDSYNPLRIVDFQADEQSAYQWDAHVSALIDSASKLNEEKYLVSKKINNNTDNSVHSVADELTKLAALLEKGLITDSEFIVQKNKLLS